MVEVTKLRERVLRCAVTLIFAEKATRRDACIRLRDAVIELVLQEEGSDRLRLALLETADESFTGEKLRAARSAACSAEWASSFVAPGLGLVLLDSDESDGPDVEEETQP